jgi:hypothetical protein
MEIEVYKKNNDTFIVHHRNTCVVVRFEYDFNQDVYASGSSGSYEKRWRTEWNPVFYKGKHHDESSALELLLITGKTPEAWYNQAIKTRRAGVARDRNFRRQLREAENQRKMIQEEVGRVRAMLASGNWLPTAYIMDLQEKIGIPRGSNYL